MAMSHDYHVMRSDRGWMRLPGHILYIYYLERKRVCVCVCLLFIYFSSFFCLLAVDLGLRLPDLLLQTVMYISLPPSFLFSKSPQILTKS